MIRYFVLCLCLLSLSSYSQYKTQWIVSKDSSGDFTTIQHAINACKSFPDKRITILVKNGIYNEKVVVHSWNTNITLIGESKDSTIITYGDFAGKENNATFYTYTVKVCGNDFRMENITVENNAGEVGQAVALHVEADRVIIKNCRLVGNQDTLFASGENNRQYFKNCYIEGTTDYIFGGATAVFEACTIHSKRNSYITAASTPQGVKHGFVFLNCKLTFAPGVNKVYLGRPWRIYSKTVFIRCEMDEGILAEGWNNWSKREAENTVFYGEFGNTGAGSDLSGRVKWARLLTSEEAEKYTVKNIFTEITEQVVNWYEE